MWVGIIYVVDSVPAAGITGLDYQPAEFTTERLRMHETKLSPRYNTCDWCFPLLIQFIIPYPRPGARLLAGNSGKSCGSRSVVNSARAIIRARDTGAPSG